MPAPAPDYRPIPDSRLDEFHAAASYAFVPEDGPVGPDDELPAPATVGEPYGLFDDEDALLSVSRHYDLSMRLRGRYRPTLGLSAVATPPENRRRGLVRRMLGAALEGARERDVPFAALWPFAHPFYRRFGWATANEYAVHECAPRALGFARDAIDDGVDGRVRALDPDEWPRLADVLAEHGARHELTLDHDEEWWRKRVFRGWGEDPYVYGWADESDRLRGYLTYEVSSDGDAKTLSVSRFAYTDHAARLHLLRFLADHDSQVSTVRLTGPADTSLFHLVDDPDDVTTRVRPGPMVRLVSVPDALEALEYPADAAGTAILDVRDDLADWNDATWRLRVDDGAARVAETSAEPNAVLDVGALAQLVVGYRDPTSLTTTGDLEADSAAHSLLADAFPEADPYLREGF